MVRGFLTAADGHIFLDEVPLFRRNVMPNDLDVTRVAHAQAHLVGDTDERDVQGVKTLQPG